MTSEQTKRGLEELSSRISGRRLFLDYDRVYDAEDSSPGAYIWQKETHDAGLTNSERMLMAANRVGKTQSAGAETAMHLIGKYPGWWAGYTFRERAIKAWTGAASNELSRDVVQLALLGPEGAHGTGWIPRESIVDVKYRQAGVPNVVDMIQVRHKSGGISIVTLKTYEQGANKWQGGKLDWIWGDEEPPMDIYTEMITRTLDSRGRVLITFTPLLGSSEVVVHFLNAKTAGIFVKNVGWDEAPHLDEDAKQRLWDSYPEHERETRAKGTPLMGSGAIFPIGDSEISVTPAPIPNWWPCINGVDFGIDHPAAGAFLAHDRDSDTLYVYDCYKASGQTAVYHADALKKHGDWIPNAWPRDGLERDKGSGIALKDQYRGHGAFMLREPAHYPDERGNHVEPGLLEMLERMRTGKFKVFANLLPWFEEKRLYHRKDNQVVKIREDIMSATRYAVMMCRFAQLPTPTAPPAKGPTRPIMGPGRLRLLA